MKHHALYSYINEGVVEMTTQETHLTREGYQQFKTELEHLRNVRRKEVAELLHEAMEDVGEAGEDPALDAARDEQSFVEGRILQLENLLANARIFEEETQLSFGTRKSLVDFNSVVILHEEGMEAETVRVVGSAEADPVKGKISDVSPLGQALMGKKTGDRVTVKTPGGDLTYTIDKVINV